MVILILIGAMLLVGVPLYIQYRISGSPSANKPMPRAQSSWHHHHPTGKSKGNGKAASEVKSSPTQAQGSEVIEAPDNRQSLHLQEDTTSAKTQVQAQVEPATQPQNEEESQVCCGLHEVCEKLATNSTKIEYFDDEELDAFAGRDPQSYNDGEIDQFRDVMTTMYPSEVALWRQSLQLRGVALPVELEDEFMLIMSEV